MDVGCATGDLVKEFWNWGISALGIEGSEAVVPYLESKHVSIADVRLPLIGYGRFDLCMCLEVFEHIEPEYADAMLDNLCTLADKHLVSAAPPGQDGHYHVNCQPVEYWTEKYLQRGFYPKHEITNKIRREIEPWKSKKGILAWYNNLAYYERG